MPLHLAPSIPMKILYESEVYKWKIAGSMIAISVLLAIIIWMESWMLRATLVLGDKAPFAIFVNVAILIVLGIPLFYMVRYLFIPSPKIIVDSCTIQIGDLNIPFNSIAGIVVDAQKKIRTLDDQEQVIIDLVSGERYTINVFKYVNGNLFRMVCDEIQKRLSYKHFELNDFPALPNMQNTVSLDDLGDEKFEKHLFGFNFLRFFGVVIIIGTVYSCAVPKAALQARLVSILFFLLLSGVRVMLLRYIMLSPNYIVVKSIAPVLKPQVYPMKNIRKVWTNQRGALFIMTLDYKIYRYQIPIPKRDDDTLDVINGYLEKSKLK